MIRHVPVMLLALIFLSGAHLTYFGGGASVSLPPIQTPLQALVATMPVDSLQCLNCQIDGSGQASATLTHLTTGSGCYWDGNPGLGCPSSPAGGDAFTDDLMYQAHYAGTSTGGLLAFGSVGFRTQKGHEVAIIMNAGGHASTDIGGVFKFDLEAAAACLVAEGGWGHASCGTWTNPVKPGRLISSANPRPTDLGDGIHSGQWEDTCTASWTAPQSPTMTITLSNCKNNYGELLNNLDPVGNNIVFMEYTPGITVNPGGSISAPAQTQITGCSSFTAGAGTCTINTAATSPRTNVTVKFANNRFWLVSNPDGHLTNESVHQYFGIAWAGGSNFVSAGEITGGGYDADWVTGLVTIFNDSTNLETRVFPPDDLRGNTVGGWCGQASGGVWDAASGNFYCFHSGGSQLWQWTGFPGTPVSPGNPSGVPPTLNKYNSGAPFAGHASIVNIADPVNAGKRAMVQYASAFSTTCNGHAYSNSSGITGFVIWFDINGAGVNADSCAGGANFAGTFPFVGSSLSDAWAYDNINNQILIYHQPWQGPSPPAEPTSYFTTLWKITPSTTITNWTVTAGWTGAGGCSNGSTPGPCSPTLGPNFYSNSGSLPRLMVSDDGTFAIISVHAGGPEYEWLWRLR